MLRLKQPLCNNNLLWKRNGNICESAVTDAKSLSTVIIFKQEIQMNSTATTTRDYY